MAMNYIEEFDIPFGSAAMDVLDVPLFRDGRPMKKVVLICPECGEKGIWIEPPDTALKFGDAASECDECGYGLDYL